MTNKFKTHLYLHLQRRVVDLIACSFSDARKIETEVMKVNDNIKPIVRQLGGNP